MRSRYYKSILFVLSLYLGAGCFLHAQPNTEQGAASQESIKTRTSVPDSIIEKANQFIIARVGDDFFSKYISFNDSLSRYCPVPEFFIKNPGHRAAYLLKPFYSMVYSLKIPEKPFVNELMDCALDTNGNVIYEREPSIPNCLREPTECDFPIDEKKAIEIAKNAGLEAGIRDWETSFHWYYGDVKSFVWTVTNMLSENRQDGSSHGKTMVIDANTGKVIKTSSLEIQQ
jgi:hypothetical protein